jgi:DNA-binding CsgD family transcriptional regulator
MGAQAKRTLQIAFSFSERTVENHARNIYVKIGCQKVNEFIRVVVLHEVPHHSICRH